MAPLVKKGMIETAPISKENPVRLASRASQLAMAQTHEVARRLDPVSYTHLTLPTTLNV